MIQRTLAFPITSHFFKSGSPIGYQENYDLERICGLVDFAGLLERDSAFAPDFARRQSPCAAPQDSLHLFFPRNSLSLPAASLFESNGLIDMDPGLVIISENSQTSADGSVLPPRNPPPVGSLAHREPPFLRAKWLRERTHAIVSDISNKRPFLIEMTCTSILLAGTSVATIRPRGFVEPYTQPPEPWNRRKARP